MVEGERGECPCRKRAPRSGRADPAGPSVVSSCSDCGRLEVNFVVHTKSANPLFLCLFPPQKHENRFVRNLDRQPVELSGHTGDLRHVAVSGVHQDCAYAFWIAGSKRLLLDVRARFVEGTSVASWGKYEGESYDCDDLAEYEGESYDRIDQDETKGESCDSDNTGPSPASRVESYLSSFRTLAELGISFPFRLGRLFPPQASREFDWKDDKPPQLSLSDVVIYEAHARGLTMALPARGANPPARGTFSAIVDRLDYLQWLGVTALQLLPIAEFNELESNHMDELSELREAGRTSSSRRVNMWGYSPLQPAGFTPMCRYGETTSSVCQELKLLVRELHRRGMECYLDVVYNHVAGASCSLHFLDVASDYFIVDKHGAHVNISGCGNTLSPNSPAMTRLIVDSLRWWVAEYHVDGFRIDAAGVLARDEHGTPVKDSRVLSAIASDPLLGNGKVKITVEPWDAGDGIGSPNFLIGSYPLSTALEWNPDYQRALRRFLFRGDDKKHGRDFARQFCKAFRGSEQLYSQRANRAHTSVNYLSCHDGFSVADSAAYNARTNTDGPGDDGTTYNHGAEGRTCDGRVLLLRARQLRNLTLALALSRGTPLVWQGCETGATKGGDSNAYATDGAANWLAADPGSVPLARFTRAALALRRTRGAAGADFHDGLAWLGASGERMGARARSGGGGGGGDLGLVACTLRGGLYVAFNAAREERRVALPNGCRWRLVCDTGAADGAYFRAEGRMELGGAGCAATAPQDAWRDRVMGGGEGVDMRERSAVVFERVDSD